MARLCAHEQVKQWVLRRTRDVGKVGGNRVMREAVADRIGRTWQRRSHQFGAWPIMSAVGGVKRAFASAIASTPLCRFVADAAKSPEIA